MQKLTNKNIILAVSGSIAAYKSPDIVRRLQDLGASVKVVLTAGGEKFITKLSLETVSNNTVYSDAWDSEMQHIQLAKWANIIVIAPASANTIANIAAGNGNDLLSLIVLATNSKVILVPAMNKKMLNNNIVADNLKKLQTFGIKIIDNEIGEQVCGDFGDGRMPDPVNIASFVAEQFQSSKLCGKKILITMGATIEKIDPVRYLSNFSSGKMGLALAQSCIDMGAKTILIYGNISIDLPEKSTNIRAISADEMYASVMQNIEGTDVFIGVAAVSDYKIKKTSKQKIKKNQAELHLELVKNPDILQTVAALKNKPFCVGFAAETENLIKNAKIKLHNKNLDIIIANDAENTFEKDNNEVFIITQYSQEKIKSQHKSKVATAIIQKIIQTI